MRPKLFLTFAAFCTLPLLVISLISFRNGLKNTESLLRNEVHDELSDVSHHYQWLVDERENELRTLTRGPLPNYLRNATTPEPLGLIESSQVSTASAGLAAEAAITLGKAITNLPYSGLHFERIGCFDSNRRLMFIVEPEVKKVPTFRSKDHLLGGIEPNSEHVWDQKSDSARCSMFLDPTFGTLERCSIPIFLTDDDGPGSSRGALVADIRLDRLLETAAKRDDV